MPENRPARRQPTHPRPAASLGVGEQAEVGEIRAGFTDLRVFAYLGRDET